jgi:hypothetical protein
MQDGKSIKMLATASRLDIEDFLQKKVYLEVAPSSLMWLPWTCLPSPAATQFLSDSDARDSFLVLHRWRSK